MHPALRNSLIVLGIVWALPMTLLGLLAGFATLPFGARLRRHGIALVFHHFPIGPGGALTLGNVILDTDANLDRECLTYHCAAHGGTDRVSMAAHERAHVYQYLVLGVFFLPFYFACGGISWRNRFEQAADRYAATGKGWWPWESPEVGGNSKQRAGATARTELPAEVTRVELDVLFHAAPMSRRKAAATLAAQFALKLTGVAGPDVDAGIAALKRDDIPDDQLLARLEALTAQLNYECMEREAAGETMAATEVIRDRAFAMLSLTRALKPQGRYDEAISEALWVTGDSVALTNAMADILRA